ncbi:hypothetical protein GCM10027051_31100 [Niabella terrae]
MKYPCTGCGACCRQVATSVAQINEFIDYEFPYSWDETGKCEMLDESNMCKVYDDRPVICNVEKFAELTGLDKLAFYKMNAKFCNNLIDAEGLDEKFKIKDYE